MKKLIMIMIGVAMLIALVGCSQETVEVTTTTKQSTMLAATTTTTTTEVVTTTTTQLQTTKAETTSTTHTTTKPLPKRLLQPLWIARVKMIIGCLVAILENGIAASKRL